MDLGTEPSRDATRLPKRYKSGEETATEIGDSVAAGCLVENCIAVAINRQYELSKHVLSKSDRQTVTKEHAEGIAC
jgi:hypothetical protein